MLHKMATCCKMFLISFVFIACSNKKEDEKLFKEVEIALTNSNKVIQTKEEECMHQLQRDLQDIKVKDKAAIWHPKAAFVEKLSNDLIAFINSLQEKIKGNNNNRLDKIDAAILYKELINYKQKILLIDAEIDATFKNIVDIVDDKNENEFIQSTNNANAKIKLSLCMNKIEVIKLQIVQFCSVKYTYCGFIFDTYKPLISQNIEHFKPNEVLEITAGIGAFASSARPKVFVDNNPIESNANGVVVYKTKVPSIAGKYHKTITIKFFNPNTGKEETKEVEINYTVDE